MAEIKEICKTDAEKIYEFFQFSDGNFSFFYSKKENGTIQYYVNNGGIVFGPYKKLPREYITPQGVDLIKDFSWYGFINEEEYVFKNGEILMTEEETIPTQKEIEEILDNIAIEQQKFFNENYYNNETYKPQILEKHNSKNIVSTNHTSKEDIIIVKSIKGKKYLFFNEKQISVGVKGEHIRIIGDYICYTRNKVPYIMKNGREYNGKEFFLKPTKGFIYLDKGFVYFEKKQFANWWSDFKNKTNKQEENYERFAAEGKLVGE